MNEIVLDHYRNPRNIGALDEDDTGVGTGTCSAPGEGVVIQMQVRIDALSHRIAEARFKAFGCAWSIAACSFLTEWVTGRAVGQALAEAADAMVAGLQLPPERVRQAALVAEALRAAIEDWRARPDVPGASAARNPDVPGASAARNPDVPGASAARNPARNGEEQGGSSGAAR